MFLFLINTSYSFFITYRLILVEVSVCLLTQCNIFFHLKSSPSLIPEHTYFPLTSDLSISFPFNASICHLSLHNITTNSVMWNNTLIIYHSFCGPGASAQLSCVLSFRASKGSIRALARSAVSSEAGLEKNLLPSSCGSWENSVSYCVRNWWPVFAGWRLAYISGHVVPPNMSTSSKLGRESLLENGEFPWHVTILCKIIT